MRIAVLGGTGRTGRLVVQQALACGYAVKMLARTASKVSERHERLTVIQGDLLDEDCVQRAVQGTDAVLSVLGPKTNQPEFAISSGMNVILRAMAQYDVCRIVMSTGAGVREPQDRPKPIDHVIRFLLHTVSKNVVADMEAAVRAVQASDRDWTVVRAPMLTDAPAQNTLKIGYVGDIGARLSRADLAAFLVKQLTDEAHVRQAPAVSN